MEGVTDAPMRAFLGEAGGLTFAVSEFVRVAHSVPSAAVFRRSVPELHTPARLPVAVQLLGGDPGRVAEAAVVAVRVGATAIDLNFGCPAPTVNRHDGGATLLKDPPRVRAVVAAVRAAVPRHIPVSAKLRLGWDDPDTIFRTGELAAEGGASWLTVHARTRVQGYAPPVDWTRIGRVRERLQLPVVANGDIWTVEGFRRCRDETGCRHYMLGRGAVADPGLPRRVAAELSLGAASDPTPPDWPALVRKLGAHTPGWNAHPARGVKRVKQWLRIAALCGTFHRFDAVKRAGTMGELLAALTAAPARPPEPRPPDGRPLWSPSG
jgi:tRNA-dihydrouridine synthase C